MDAMVLEPDAIISAEDEAREMEREAKRREPWRYPDKPSIDAVRFEAERLKTEHSFRILVNAVMRQWLNGERQGHFPRDAELIRSGEMIPVPITKLRDEHYDYCVWHSRMNITFEKSGRGVIEDEEVDAVLDYSRLLIDQWKDEFSEQDDNGDLMMALPDTAGATGMLAAYVAPKPSNEETGVSFRMLDPSAVYPVWEGERGLAKVYLAYLADADHVVGHYGDNGGRVERKVRKIVRNDTRAVDDGAELVEKEVIVRYDRQWVTILWGGDLIWQYQHGLGDVPVLIQSSGVGMQGFMNSPNPIISGSDTDILVMGADYWRANSRQLDMARKSQPPLWRRVAAHAFEEALATRIGYSVTRATKDPPIVIKQGVMSAAEGEPEVDVGEKGRILLRADDAIEEYPMGGDPQVMATLLTIVGQNSQTGMAIGVINPNPGGAQASGNAIDMLKQDGNERWAVITLMIEKFLAKCVSRALSYVEKEGDAFGDYEDPGVLLVPRSRPSRLMGKTDPHEFTPEIVARVGAKVKVFLRKFNSSSLPPLIQALLMGQSAGLMSQKTAVSLIGAVEDIEEEIRRIKEDQLSATPELMAAERLELGYKRAYQAMVNGDEESARREILKTKYLADQLTVAMMARLSMVSQSTMEAMQQAGLAQMSGASMFQQSVMQPQLAALGQGQGMDPNVAPYMSPSPLGGTTGNQGGRPMGNPNPYGG